MKYIRIICLILCLTLSSTITNINAYNPSENIIEPYITKNTYLSKTAKIYTTINGVSNTYWISIKLSVKVAYDDYNNEIKSVGTPVVTIESSYLPSDYKLGALTYDDIRSAIINSDNTVTAIAGIRVPVKTSSGANTNYAFPGGTSYYYISFSNWSI